ncbi:MAG: hypothetical protein ACUVTH_15315, partial [Thermogutta sp.]
PLECASLLSLSYGVRRLAVAVSCDSLLSLFFFATARCRFLTTAYRPFLVQPIMGDSKLPPY